MQMIGHDNHCINFKWVPHEGLAKNPSQQMNVVRNAQYFPPVMRDNGKEICCT